MRDLVFQFPNAAYILLLFAVILILQIYLYSHRIRSIQAYASEKLLPWLLIGRSKIISYMKIAAWGLIWILAGLALMSPEGNIHYLPSGENSKEVQQSNQTYEVVFLIDTSSSMSVADGSNGQTRLDEAKEIMQNIVSQLKGVSLAVYAFTSELTPVVPSTLDYLFTRMMIDDLHINEGDVGGTLFAPVLEALKSKALTGKLAHAHGLIILSDGGDNEVYKQNPPSEEALQKILNVFSDLEANQLKIFTVGLGKPNPSIIPKVTDAQGKPVESQLQSELLDRLAKEGQGEFYAAYQWNDWDLSTKLIQNINAAIDQNKQEAVNPERKIMPVKEEDKIADLYYQIPLGMAIVLLLAGMLIPDVKRKGFR